MYHKTQNPHDRHAESTFQRIHF
jgi:hypothetical protein